jgi:hypothetical protein
VVAWSGDFTPEPGDKPDPVVGYSCDPVERVCVLLKALLILNAFKLIALIILACAFLR